MTSTSFQSAAATPRAPRTKGGGGRSRRNAALPLVAAVLAVLAASAARAAEWGPWSAREEFPVLAMPGEESRPGARPGARDAAGPAGLPLVALVRLYQAYLSPVYGDRCPMFPSCSQYAVDALRKHGPLVGIVMTSGRLMHESDERSVAPIRKSGDRYLFLDPVENNDFWFAAR